MFITVEQARAQCRVEAADDDDATLLECARAAEIRCARLANRSIFLSADAKAAAIASTLTALDAARATYDADIAAIPYDAGPVQRASAYKAAIAALDAAVLAHEQAVVGIIINDDIMRAMLLTLGKYYRHREDVTDERVATLPDGAERIMRHYRWTGDL